MAERTARWELRRIWRATVSASSISDSWGTTLETRFHSSAWRASIGGDQHVHGDADAAGVDKADQAAVAVVEAPPCLERAEHGAI